MDLKQREKISESKRQHGHAGSRVSGEDESPEYTTWRGMRERCDRPTHNLYHRYGGRGIRVCERWQSFENFVADMGPKPEGTSIDRIDNNGNYEPGNCRWATREEQARNNTRSRHLTFNGETLCLSDWAARIGVSRATLEGRLERGWPLEDALAHGPGHQVLERKAKGNPITFQGRTMRPSDWARELGIPATTIYRRLSAGLPVEQVLSTDKLPRGSMPKT
jgi:hypothetical protein